MTVLMFASTVLFIFNDTARSLIVRRADDAGTRWERIELLEPSIGDRESPGYFILIPVRSPASSHTDKVVDSF